MSLLYPARYQESLITTQEIQRKVNRAFGRDVLILRSVENKQYDGWCFGFETELKQRTGHRPEYIREVYEDPAAAYPDTTIPRSSTTHGSKLFIIYDATLRYVQLFTQSDISEEVRQRTELTECGYSCVEQAVIPNDRIDLIDLENADEVRQAFLKRKAELEAKLPEGGPV